MYYVAMSANTNLSQYQQEMNCDGPLGAEIFPARKTVRHDGREGQHQHLGRSLVREVLDYTSRSSGHIEKLLLVVMKKR
jgi:hypothetical protein